MRTLKIVFSLLLPITLIACTSSYVNHEFKRAMSNAGVADTHRIYREAEWGLAQSTSIALMPLAVDQSAPNPRTTAMLNTAFLDAFGGVFPHSATLKATTDFERAILRASLAGCEILLIPKLVQVKNKLNTRHEFQEGPHLHPGSERGRDKVTVHLLIYEVQSGDLLDRIQMTSHAAFFKNDEKLPMHMLKDALEGAAFHLARLPAG